MRSAFRYWCFFAGLICLSACTPAWTASDDLVGNSGVTLFGNADFVRLEAIKYQTYKDGWSTAEGVEPAILGLDRFSGLYVGSEPLKQNKYLLLGHEGAFDPEFGFPVFKFRPLDFKRGFLDMTEYYYGQVYLDNFATYTLDDGRLQVVGRRPSKPEDVAFAWVEKKGNEISLCTPRSESHYAGNFSKSESVFVRRTMIEAINAGECTEGVVFRYKKISYADALNDPGVQKAMAAARNGHQSKPYVPFGGLQTK